MNLSRGWLPIYPSLTGPVVTQRVGLGLATTMFGFGLDNFGWARLLDMVLQPLFTENTVYKTDLMSVFQTQCLSLR